MKPWPSAALRAFAALALTSFAFLVYAWRLSDTPVFLHDAEVLFALHIRAIASTLHDANGRFLPLYIQMPQIGENVWFHPMLVYVSAPFLKVFPLTEWSLRLPAVCAGIADVALMYLVARRLFASRAYGLLAAALLACTPAHFIHSRFAMDYILPLPFILGWMWCLLRFEEDRRERWVWMAALLLGACFYSYIGAVMLVPLYFVMTCVYLLDVRRGFDRTLAVAATGFALPLALLLMWLPAHPQMFDETIGRYGVPTGTRLGALRHLVSYTQIQEYIARYWTLSSPVYLFFVGSSNWVDSTRRAGVFLLPMAPLLAAGLCDFVLGPRTRMQWLILAGLLTAPIGAVFVGEPWAIQRELELVPFAVLLAVYGVRRLRRSAQPLVRAAAAVALLLSAVQFADFYRDYFTDYRLNSLGAFGPNIRGAVAEVLRERPSAPPAAVYVSTTIPYAMEHWHFYLAKAGREDLWPRTRPFDATAQIAAMPAGSIVIEPLAGGKPMDASAGSPELTQTGLVSAPEGGTRFAVLERR